MLKLREIQPSDSQWLRQVRNQASVRAQSFSDQPISEDTHQRWFARQLAEPRGLLLVADLAPTEPAQASSTPIGYVRFEPEAETGQSLISIALDDRYRGQGHGKALLLESTRWYFRRFSAPIVAYIKPDNQASVRVFEQAGYQPQPEHDNPSRRCYRCHRAPG